MEFIRRVFEVVKRAYWHQFQILAKRADRLEELFSIVGAAARAVTEFRSTPHRLGDRGGGVPNGAEPPTPVRTMRLGVVSGIQEEIHGAECSISSLAA